MAGCNKMSENKECLFYIDHNPPEYSGTWGGAIHKGACKVNSTDCKDTDECFIKNLYSKLKRKEQECEELHSRTASIIYSLTGGRLSYSTYTLEGCEDAYRDQLSIDVERATKELEEENAKLKQECKNLEEELRGCRIGISQNLYLDLEKFIEPRLLDDFCGYDEESQGFNIVLAVKQIIEAKEQELQEVKEELWEK